MGHTTEYISIFMCVYCFFFSIPLSVCIRIKCTVRWMLVVYSSSSSIERQAIQTHIRQRFSSSFMLWLCTTYTHTITNPVRYMCTRARLHSSSVWCSVSYAAFRNLISCIPPSESSAHEWRRSLDEAKRTNNCDRSISFRYRILLSNRTNSKSITKSCLQNISEIRGIRTRDRQVTLYLKGEK